MKLSLGECNIASHSNFQRSRNEQVLWKQCTQGRRKGYISSEARVHCKRGAVSKYYLETSTGRGSLEHNNFFWKNSSLTALIIYVRCFPHTPSSLALLTPIASRKPIYTMHAFINVEAFLSCIQDCA